MEKRKLKNPPIREAVFDLRFATDTQISVDVIKVIAQELKDFFPIQNEMFQITVEHKFLQEQKKVESSDSLNSNGIRFQDLENKWVFQVRVDGITLSKLKN